MISIFHSSFDMVSSGDIVKQCIKKEDTAFFHEPLMQLTRCWRGYPTPITQE